MAKRLIRARLVGAERTSALQHQHALRFRGRHGRRGFRNIHHERQSNEKRQSAAWRQFKAASIGAFGETITPCLSRVRGGENECPEYLVFSIWSIARRNA